MISVFFFFSSRRRHTRSYGDWSSDVCSSDLDWNRQLFRSNTADCSNRPRSRTDLLLLDFAERAEQDVHRRAIHRSEERRVGKECRAREWPRTVEKRRHKSRTMQKT